MKPMHANTFLLFLLTAMEEAHAFSATTTSTRFVSTRTFLSQRNLGVRHVFNRRIKEEITRENQSVESLFSIWNTERNVITTAADEEEVFSSGGVGNLLFYDAPQEKDTLVEGYEKQGVSVNNPQALLIFAFALISMTTIGITTTMGITIPEPQEALTALSQFTSHPQESLQAVIESVKSMGPAAPIYFGIIYLIAEILAVPATPLTLSAGYLFGLQQGVCVVLLAATIAASISFVIGKTFLRSWVEELLLDNPKFAKIDKAIGKEGFKILLLVRLSPIFPFALSNYLYGASSISFPAYFWGTLLGFAPGTFAYVYTGMVGQALTLGDGSALPLDVYAGGFAVLLGLLKLVTDVATEVIEAVGEDEDGGELTQMP